MSGPAVASFGARQAQPLGSLFADAKASLEDLFGKADPKDLPPFARAAVENTERIRGIAARLFAPNSEGEELLEALCDAVVRRPHFITQLGLPSDQVLAMGQFREGMTAAVFLLLAWIAQGRSEQLPRREGGENHAHNARKRRRVAKSDDRPTPDDVRAGRSARRRRRR